MAQSATEKKPSLSKRISRGFRDMLGEMKRVVWPSRKQTVNNTALVLIFMAVMAVVIGLFDTALAEIIRLAFGS